MNPRKQAVVYDCDAERATQVSGILRQLGYHPMVIDHSALVRTVLNSGSGGQVLLIGDVVDDPDWADLGAALRDSLCDLAVVSYGSPYVADELAQVAGENRVMRLRFPFDAGTLAGMLSLPLVQNQQELGSVVMPTGSSPAISAVSRLIRQVAAHGSSVLILGESGTGKELVARAVHDASPRRARPFVAINCGAIPAELLESELFGHEKGAFTGAITARKGRFEIAEGGTLFLDEIGDMSMTMQVKLLRVLQEKVFERVGSHTQIRCNVRIIAATHRNLEEAIAKGGFREDLFYRLNVFPIEMPPLRERLSDLPLLIRDFIELNATQGRTRIQLQRRVLDALLHYAWPGNVRELANLMERLSILCPQGVVDLVDLPAKYRPAINDMVQLTDITTAVFAPAQDILVSDLDNAIAPLLEAPPEAQLDTLMPLDELNEQQALKVLNAEQPGEEHLSHLPSQGLDLRSHLYEIERALIRQAMERSGGTVAHAARLLQLRRTTLVEKLRKFDLFDDRMASEV